MSPVETIPNQDDHGFWYLHELRGREIVITALSSVHVSQFVDVDQGFKPLRLARFYTHDRQEPADGLLVISGFLLTAANDWEENPRSPDYLAAGLLVKRRPFPTAVHERWELIERQPADV